MGLHNPTSEADCLRAALAYLDRGWTPIPLRAREKAAAVGWKHYQFAPPTADFLCRAYSQHPGWNVGMLMGGPARLLCVDVDRRHGGLETIRGMALPPTRVISSGDGGWHYVYRTETATPPTKKGALQGIDLIGLGSYIVAPPSIHPNGQSYSVAIDAEPVPPPAWVYDLLREPDAVARTVNASEGPSRQLFVVACGFVGDAERCLYCGGGPCRRDDPAHLIRRLSACNLKRFHPPLPPSEVDRVARNAWRISRDKKNGKRNGIGSNPGT